MRAESRNRAIDAVNREIDAILSYDTSDEAIEFMFSLDVQRKRLDRALADPRQKWAK